MSRPTSQRPITFLSEHEVLHIHDRVSSAFATTDDPVGADGVRDWNLLRSAIARQETGYGGLMKYSNPYSNAATLTAGICCNHAFHNGNKRTALVSMIAHLNKNDLILHRPDSSELYSMIKAVARRDLGVKPSAVGTLRRSHDDEVEAIHQWLRKNARKSETTEKRITYRDLRRALGHFGFVMVNPQNSKITICRVTQKRTLLRLRKVRAETSVLRIGYPGESKTVPVGTVRRVRKQCGLENIDGVDSRMFYNAEDRVDLWINDWRGVLAKLSKE